MSEHRRRRRYDDDDDRGGLPLFPLVLVVILAGLVLGGALAHFLGPKNPSTSASSTVAAAPSAVLPSPALTPAPVLTTPPAPTPLPTHTPAALPTASPTPSLTPTPRSTALARATPTASPTASAVPGKVARATPNPALASPKPTLAAHVVAATTTSPKPTLAAHVVAAAPKPTLKPALTPISNPGPQVAKVPAAPATATPAIATQDDQASTVVRSYLDALARGDRSTASSYLVSGTPSETFINSNSRIQSIRAASAGPQQYRVTADVQTTNGEYFITFTVEQGPGGLQIADHYWIKPQ